MESVQENVYPDISPSSSCLSSSRDPEHLNTDASVEHGCLDLSNQQLTGVCPQFKTQYNEVTRLNISHNKLHSLKSQLFPNCKELNLSYNLLNRISCLAPLASRLTRLDISNNDLVNIDGIQQYLRLETLLCANNALRVVPLLQTFALTIVDLSGNLLPDIPDLSHLLNLQVLNLSRNKITILKHIPRISKDLKELSLESNQVTDISELVLLSWFQKLDNLSIFPLPAFPSEKPSPFNYRHLILCLVPTLEVLDGDIVENADSICGEHLLMQGKLTGNKREFTPGGGHEAHKYVWEYLTKKHQELVVGQEKKDTPLKASMMKALRMKEVYGSRNPRKTLTPRQESVEPSPAPSRATEDDFSSHSPFADWSKRIGKENTDPETTDGSPISTQRSTFSRNLRIIEGGKRVVRRSGSVGSRFSQMTHKECESETEKEESTPVPQMKSASTTPEALVKSPPKPKPRTVRVSKTPEKQSSSEFSSENEEEVFTPKASSKMTLTPLSRKRIPLSARRFDVADVTFSRDIYAQMEELEEKMRDMAAFCENLSKTNEQLAGLLVEQQERFTKEMANMNRQIADLKAPPKPVALSVLRRNGDSIEIKWEVQLVKEYNVYINGRKSGTIQAPGRIARVSDLEKDREHVIELQAVSLEGVAGPLSDPLRISST